MEKFRRWSIQAMLIVLAVAASGADQLQDIIDEGEISVGISLGGEPIGFRDDRHEPNGYDVDMARRLAAKLGVDLEIVEVTGANRVPMLVTGQIDVIISNLTATLERAKAIDFSMPYLRTGIKLLVQRESDIQGMGDLGGRRVVVGRGSTGEVLVKRLAPEARLVYVDSYAPEGILLMRQGRADAAIEDATLIDYTARLYPDQLILLAETHTSDAICFGVRKGELGFLRWLDMFISEYVRTGAYEESYRKWWGGDPSPITPLW